MTKVSVAVSRSASVRRLVACSFVLVLSSAALAQVQAPPQSAHTTGVPQSASATSVDASATQAVSQFQQPPRQAVIETRANNLTIRADNASLTQTLQRISDKTGMQLEGVSGDQRVFGNFGPGTPREVLGSLLNGTGYNIVMIGSLENGAPRQLLLSQKKADQSSGRTAQLPNQQQTFSPADDDAGDPAPEDQAPVSPPPHGGPDGTGPGVRTPQQMMQQMQQMRQQADQQQAPQQ